jgi:hypothetical protein
VDYRLKGYRAPQSRITPDLSDAALLRFNFEWFASSSHSLGIDAPRFENGIVKIPIHLDDFDLHTGRVDYDSWERDLLRRAESADFIAVGLHDCYGPHWLPRYRGLLERLGELARLTTFDEVLNETALGATRWR